MLLLRESLILHKLNHPAIIKFIGVNFQTFPRFNTGDSKNKIHPTIITEYMQNGSLENNLSKERDSLATEKWSPTKKYIILLGIADAMRYLHENGIIHRDLKPQNILNDSNFYPRICDFGLSRCLPEILSSTQLSMTEGVGTPIYMAPELFSLDSVYDKSVDVYAFGILAYEIITGREPYEELKKDELNAIQFARLVESGRRPSLEPRMITEKMEDLLKRCWDKDKKIRPSFAEIYNELSSDFSYSIEDVEEEEINEYIEKLDNAREQVETKNNKKNVKEPEPERDENKKGVQLFPFFAGFSLAVLLLAIIFQLKTYSYNELQSKNDAKLMNQLDQTKKINEELKKLNEKTNRKNIQLQMQINNTEIVVDKLQKIYNQSEIINEKLQKEKNEQQISNKYLQNEINKTRKINFELRLNNSKSQIYNEELQFQINESQKTNKKLQKEKDELQIQINQSQKINKILQKEKDELQIQINQSQKINKILQKEKDELQIQINESQKINKKLQKEKDELQIQINQSQKINEEINKEKSENTNFQQNTELLNDKIEIFNSASLIIQKEMISKTIQNSKFQNQKIIHYLNKINDLFLYLLKFNDLRTINLFQIDVKNKNMQIQNINNEYPVIITSNAISLLFNHDLFKYNAFINLLKNFTHVSIKIEYPSPLFDGYFDSLTTFESNFPKGQVIVTVFITELEETDLKFRFNLRIKSVKLDSSVKKIYGGFFGGSFESCISLVEVIIPPSVKTIEKSAFYFCTKLKNIEIPPSVVSVGDHAFQKCLSLTKIVIPNSVTKLGSEVFAECENLQEVIFPTSLSSIGSSSFSGCIKLKEIILPPSIKKIGIFCFKECFALRKIECHLQDIPMGAFLDCTSLRILIIPPTVGEIGIDAFKRCYSLEKVAISSNIIKINKNAFSICRSLKQVTITSSYVDIADNAFPKETNIIRQNE